MKVLIFGATGMIGHGVLRSCLLDPDVTEVLAVGRTPTGRQHAKLREIQHADLFDLSVIADQLAGYDACFFCLGVSSAGMTEAEYRRLTYELTLSIAQTLAKHDPGMVFSYVSGQGTNRSGRMMWARVKGETEDALLALPLQAYMFRPGYIQPMHGARSKTRLYHALYTIAAPLFPLLKRLGPGAVTSTEAVGQAMLQVARTRPEQRIFESRDINNIS